MPNHHAHRPHDAHIAARLLIHFGTALLLTACGAKEAPKKERPPAPVTIAIAEARDVPLEVATIGSVVPFATVSVQPRVQGQITALHFKEGETVKKGAALFEIDSAPYVAALAQSEAVLARDQAQSENADVEANRFSTLVEQKLVSPQEAGAKQAAAKALRATVVADVAAVDNAKLNLSYTRVTSPVTGRTDKRQVDVGNLVQPGGAAVVVIRQVQPIQVQFALPQERLFDVQRRMHAAADAGPDADAGLDVDALIPDRNEVVAHGKLTFVGGAVDSATGTVPCKADFENANEALWPGAYVRVVLTLGTRKDAVVVPSSAVQTSQQGPFAYVVGADNTVALRPVKTSQAGDGLLVVEDGVHAGEKVVVDGQLALIPGAKVVEKPAVGSKPASGAKTEAASKPSSSAAPEGSK